MNKKNTNLHLDRNFRAGENLSNSIELSLFGIFIPILVSVYQYWYSVYQYGYIVYQYW